MPYLTLPTVNPGDVISSSAWGNVAKGNDDYNFNGRPNSVVKRDNNGAYTTTSTSFVDIDTTNLAITLTINSGKALLIFTGHFYSPSAASQSDGGFDFAVDGTRQNSTYIMGLGKIPQATLNVVSSTTFVALVTGLSVGSHTFRPQWRIEGGVSTANLMSGDGTATGDFPASFSVVEIG